VQPYRVVPRGYGSIILSVLLHNCRSSSNDTTTDYNILCHSEHIFPMNVPMIGGRLVVCVCYVLKISKNYPRIIKSIIFSHDNHARGGRIWFSTLYPDVNITWKRSGVHYICIYIIIIINTHTTAVYTWNAINFYRPWKCRFIVTYKRGRVGMYLLQSSVPLYIIII